jgi:CRISP-associated protein Cas1
MQHQSTGAPRRSRRPAIPCLNCQELFFPPKARNRFCSAACALDWWRKHTQPEMTAKAAEVRRSLARRDPPTPAPQPEPELESPPDLDPNADDLEWAERGDYWGTDGELSAPAISYDRRRIQREPLVLTGHGVQLRIHHKTLLIRDGFTHYPQARHEYRFFPGDRKLPSRIVMLDADGSISIDVVTWLAEQRIPLVLLDWQGQVQSVLSGRPTAPDPKLWAAQVAAQSNGSGLRLAIQLVRDKLTASIDTLLTLPPSPRREHAIERVQWELKTLAELPPTTVDDLRLIEGRGALSYFAAWQDLPIRWKGRNRQAIPPEWERIGWRASLLGRTNRNATHPVNSMLNFAYGCLEAQMRVTVVVAGLEPTIGYLHANHPGRVALVYDLMEPLRPIVDRQVLDLIRSHTFAASDFVVSARGVCRLHPQLAQAMAQRQTSDQKLQEVVWSALQGWQDSGYKREQMTRAPSSTLRPAGCRVVETEP